MLLNRAARYGFSTLVALALVVFTATPAMAQAAAAADPNPGNVTVNAGFDVLNQYMFRGIRQNSTEVAMWPWADLGLAVYSGDGGVKSVGINVGSWNSLHTGDTGSNGASGKLWYEGDFYATLGLGFGGGVSLGTTYTAYTSPNNMFSTVKEIMFKLGVDDTAYLGKGALKPYALIAFEFDTASGLGQADAGDNAGKYVELGIAPGYAGSKASVAFPIKVGLSAGDYYELNVGTARVPRIVDNKFGYFSAAAIATIPLGGTTSLGAWNIHGGVEFQALGDTTKALNGGEGSQAIGSFGFGLSY